MKNLRLYETESSYLSEKHTHAYPTVSYCGENEEAQEQYDKHTYIYCGICGGIVALCMLAIYFFN